MEALEEPLDLWGRDDGGGWLDHLEGGMQSFWVAHFSLRKQ